MHPPNSTCASAADAAVGHEPDEPEAPPEDAPPPRERLPVRSPLTAGVSNALGVLPAFLVPGVQDQCDRFPSGRIVDEEADDGGV